MMRAIALQTYQMQASIAALSEESCAPCDDCPDCDEIDVPANAWGSGEMYNTGIDLVAGHHYRFIATGTWYTGADTVGPNGNSNYGSAFCYPVLGTYGALIYRVGTSGDWFLSGSNHEFDAGSSGRLYMGMNDTCDGTAHADNSGTLHVQVCET
jgi:hypothetical protein